MKWDLWVVFLFTAIGLSLTPGPNGLLSLNHGMRFGVGNAVYTVAGGCAGFLVLIAISMAGMGVLLATSETAFTITKWIGAGYLIYLGVKTWQATPQPASNTFSGKSNKEQSRKNLFLQGFLVALSNPKALIFYAAFLPHFIDPDANWIIEFIVIGGTVVTVEFIYECMLASTAQGFSSWLRANGCWFNRLTGVIFIGIGSVMATLNRS